MLASQILKQRHKRLAQAEQKGAALIEFVLLLGLLLMLVFAVVDLAVLMRKSYTLSEAARHGSRSAAALWSSQPSCVTAAPAEQACSDISLIADPLVRSVGEATCTYIELAGFTLSEWTFGFSTFNSAWINQNGTNGAPAMMANVSLTQGSNKQCLFCWQSLFGDLFMHAETRFLLQQADCLIIS